MKALQNIQKIALNTYKNLSYLALSSFLLFGQADAKKYEHITPIHLDANGKTSLPLDFSDRDYELILYPTSLPEHMRKYPTDDFGNKDKDRYSGYKFSVFSPQSDNPSITSSRAGIAGLNPSSRANNQSYSQHTDNNTNGHAEFREYEKQVAKLLSQSYKTQRASVTSPAPQTRSFNVYWGINKLYSAKNANLIGDYNNIVVYANSEYEHGLPVSRIKTALAEFDTQIYQQITRTFGEPLDRDNNKKVIFLITRLNEGHWGLFNSQSLEKDEEDIMYISADYVKSSSFRKDGLKSVLAHELQHLINFSERLRISQRDPSKYSYEEPWLNEALSHIAEDLIGHNKGNKYNLGEFLSFPFQYPLTWIDDMDNSHRGHAYLFLRGLVDDRGEGILSRLVKTHHRGTKNIEVATGKRFNDLFDKHVKRIFLSGNPFNNDLQYNYKSEYLMVGTKRTFRTPGELTYKTNSALLSTLVAPTTAAYIKLTGKGSNETISIHTDTRGKFKAILIPLPKRLNLVEFVVDDDYNDSSRGNNDGTIAAGEKIEIKLSIQNPLQKTVRTLKAQLSTHDPYVIVETSERKYWSIHPKSHIPPNTTSFLFSLKPDTPANRNITFKLTFTTDDAKWTETRTLKTGKAGKEGPVVLAQSVIDDDWRNGSRGNNNRSVDAGETIEMPVYLMNKGGLVVRNVSATLTTTDPFVTFTDRVETFGDLLPGRQTKCQDDFDFTVSPNTPSGHRITFSLKIKTATITSDTTFSVTVKKGKASVVGPIVFLVYEIDDDQRGASLGNGNRKVDAGETIEMPIYLHNQGNMPAQNASATLTTTDRFVTITDNKELFKNLTAGHSTKSQGDFDFKVAPDTPAGHKIIFSLKIKTTTRTSDMTFYVTVKTGKPVTKNDKDNDATAVAVAVNTSMRVPRGKPALLQEESEGNNLSADVQIDDAREVIEVDADPFALHPNYPNPFNPETQIPYQLGQTAEISIVIYNMLGQQVQVLANKIQAAGSYQVVWDGTDAIGREVASGTYFVRMVADQFTAVRKITLLK